MKFLKDPDFKLGFATGVVMHFIMLFSRIWGNILSFSCKESCSDILAFDIPISLFYYAFEDSMIVLFSMVLGSILWGFYFYGIFRLIKYFFIGRK